MPAIVNFDTGSDLDDFIKGSDESESEPEPSESEAEYVTGDDDSDGSDHEDEVEERHGNASFPVNDHPLRVTRVAQAYLSHAEATMDEVEDVDDEGVDSEVDDGDEADDESEAEESADSDGDDSEVDDDNSDVPAHVTTIIVRRRHTKAPRVPPLVPPPLSGTPVWYKAVADRYFSVDSGIRPFAHAKADGRHWTPTAGQRIRVGDVHGDHAFYAGKEGVVLGRSQTRPGKWRVTVHGSGLETALRGETGVAFHSSDLTPITSLKLHLNTVPTAELPVLRVLVASVTPAMVRSIQRARPFKSWPDLRKRVPALTDVTAALLKDLCAVNTSSTNTTWRAFVALGDDYATQLATWAEMSVNERLDARDDANEVIEAEKAERQRERLRRVSRAAEL